MSNQPRNLVDELRDRLQQRIGVDCYELWFADEHAFNLDGQSLVVSAADDFSLERIRSTYLSVLNRVAKDFGLDQVRYEVAKEELISKSEFAADESTDVGGSSVPGVSNAGSALGSEVARSEVARSEVARSESSRLSKLKVAKVDRSHRRGWSSGPSTAQASATNDKTIQRGNSREPVAARKTMIQQQLFSDFVVDPENELVWNACVQAIRSPGEINPLFVWGQPGSGKSHLLEGIFREARRRRSTRAQLMTAEGFTSEFVGSLKKRAMPIFRKRFRELDFLLVDDVQFFKGKQSTLVELQHTIESVVKRGGQVVLSADRSPTELDFAGPEFINRVSCGLSCELSLPAPETKLAILQQIAARRGVSIRREVLQFMADEIVGDVRLLSGAINRIKATQLVYGKSVSLRESRPLLADLVGVSRRTVSLEEIEHVVCDMFGLDRKSLKSASKTKAVSQPRMLAMWLSRRYTRAALSEIGDYFGGRSHSTVISAKSKVDQWVEQGDMVRLRHCEFPVENALRRIEHELRVG